MARRADLLVAGGVRDPNLQLLADKAEARGLRVLRLRCGADGESAFSWDMAAERARVDGVPLDADAAFVRYDVFSYGAAGAPAHSDNALGWYQAVMGWCWANPAVALFNRALDARAGSKGYMLHLAREHALDVPPTLVSNERAVVDAMAPACGHIAKPVAGGAYCEGLAEAKEAVDWRAERAPVPAFLQARLAYPEYRVYLVGARPIVFEIHAEQLDYRQTMNARIAHVGADRLPGEVVARLAAYASAVRADFCAFDLKTDPATGAPCFLEMNSAPMFAAFDRCAGGALATAIIEHLVPH